MTLAQRKRILILDTHPDSESFCAALADCYFGAAKLFGHDIEILKIRDLKFDPILHYGYRKKQEIEPDLLMAQEKIRWAEHLVIITPVWWGGLPGLFKGFIDRTFISGFSHRFNKKTNRPEGLLAHRSVRVIYTQSAPWLYSLVLRNDSFWHTLSKSILKYSGFNPVQRLYFDNVKHCSNKRRGRILETVRTLGAQGG
jgi:NAD(P)H dehydrogenase (quinone)